MRGWMTWEPGTLQLLYMVSVLNPETTRMPQMLSCFSLREIKHLE